MIEKLSSDRIGRRNGFKILVVDDDILIRKMYQTILKPPRYLVEVAEDGKVGLSKAEEIMPDLIIGDVIMPVMDGYEFCKTLRKQPKYDTTILLLSSSVLTEAKDAIKALAGGADDYLLKPIDLEQAKAKIDAFLRIKVLQDNLTDSNKQLEETVSELHQHKEIIVEKNIALEKEKEIIRNSLKEKSFLLNEIQETNKSLAKLNEQLTNNFNNFVTLLTQIIEYDRPYNKGHAQKVAKFAQEIAEKLGLSEDSVEEIKIAALIHEIGKIGIPESILTKHVIDYTDREKNIIKQYPLTGEMLLKSYDGLENVSKTIRHINENVDSTGYPDKLRGNKIPLSSRILRVVIDYDELTYNAKDPQEIHKSINDMKSLSDIKYDARIINHLVSYVNENVSLPGKQIEQINLSDLLEGMVVANDIITSSGIKLIPEGAALNQNMINIILNFNRRDPLVNRIEIVRN